MGDKGICKVCDIREATQIHHIVHRKECIALLRCEQNLIGLCDYCHDELHHGKKGNQIDKNLKLKFQNRLELIFDKEYFTEEEIRQALKISEKAVSRLCKTIVRKNGIIKREDIIRATMGGKIIISEDRE